MNVITVGLLVLSCSMVFGALPDNDEAHLNLTVSSQMTRTSESIDINYRRKYVKISTPAHDGVQPTSMFHDYDQGINVMKQHGQCYILDQFDGVPEDIKSWDRAQGAIASSLTTGGNYRVYGYRVLRFFVDRSTLPATIQEFCTGPIRIVVLDNVLDGEEALAEEEAHAEMGDDDDDSEEYSEIFIPGRVVEPTRVKRRSWLRRAWDWGRRHITVGRGPNGGWRIGVRFRW